MTRSVTAVVAALLVVLTGVTGAVATAAAAPNTAIQPAQLDIEQPAWVEEPVRTQTSSNGSVYVVRGSEFEVRPLNIEDRENVVRSGVRESTGSLRYDARDSEYIFSPEGTNGTYTLYWVVERPVSGNTTTGNATNATSTGDSTRTVTYEAKIRVEHASYAHEPVAVDDSEERKVGHWEEVMSLVGGVDGVEAKPGPVLTAIEDTAVPWIQFTQNPTAEIGGTLTALATIIIFSPGGWFWLAIWMGATLLIVGGALAYRSRARSDLPAAESVERKEQEIWAQIRRRHLKNADFVDDLGLSERWASAFRSQVGNNPLQVLDAIMRTTKPAELRAMGAVAQEQHHDTAEYRVVADDDTDPTAADLIDISADDAPEDSWAASWHPSHAPISAYEEMSWDAVSSWDALAAGVDLADVPTDVISDSARGDADDLITRLGIDLRRGFHESPEDFAKALSAYIEGVASHEHVIDGGESPQRDLVAGLYAVVESADERYNVPYVRYLKDSLTAIAEGMDADIATRRYIADARARGVDDAIASVESGRDVPDDFAPDGGTPGGDADDE